MALTCYRSNRLIFNAEIKNCEGPHKYSSHHQTHGRVGIAAVGWRFRYLVGIAEVGDVKGLANIGWNVKSVANHKRDYLIVFITEAQVKSGDA